MSRSVFLHLRNFSDVQYRLQLPEFPTKHGLMAVQEEPGCLDILALAAHVAVPRCFCEWLVF